LLTEHLDVMARVREEQGRLVAKHGPGVTGAHLRDMTYADAVIKVCACCFVVLLFCPCVWCVIVGAAVWADVATTRHGKTLNKQPTKPNKQNQTKPKSQESMRVQPIAGELLRVAARDFDLDGHRVEEGTLLSLPLRAVGAADARWVNETGALAPNAFNPDRWLTPAPAGGGAAAARPSSPAAPSAQMPFGFGARFCLGYHLAMAEMKTTLALLGQGYEFEARGDGRWEYGVGRVPVDGLPTRVARRGASEGASSGGAKTSVR
jgi:cytochrome P450